MKSRGYGLRGRTAFPFTAWRTGTNTPWAGWASAACICCADALPGPENGGISPCCRGPWPSRFPSASPGVSGPVPDAGDHRPKGGRGYGAVHRRKSDLFLSGQTAPAIDSLSLTVPGVRSWCCAVPRAAAKSTLLRQLKPALAPTGPGRAAFCSGIRRWTRWTSGRWRPASALSSSRRKPDRHRQGLARAGLRAGEPGGWTPPTIRRRVAEMAAFFGIEDWFYRDVSQLSGGQKQLLNLASVMAMQPDVLILDEPTSQLDPIAASDFLAVLGKINRELGTAVVLTEHRLEEAFPWPPPWR